MVFRKTDLEDTQPTIDIYHSVYFWLVDVSVLILRKSIGVAKYSYTN